MITAIARRFAVLAFAVMCLAMLASPTLAQATQPPKDEYVPISELPPQEQFPAARLVISAYSVVIIVLFLYVGSVARRLSAVQREVERLEADVKHTGRA